MKAEQKALEQKLIAEQKALEEKFKRVMADKKAIEPEKARHSAESPHPADASQDKLVSAAMQTKVRSQAALLSFSLEDKPQDKPQDKPPSKSSLLSFAMEDEPPSSAEAAPQGGEAAVRVSTPRMAEKRGAPSQQEREGSYRWRPGSRAGTPREGAEAATGQVAGGLLSRPGSSQGKVAGGLLSRPGSSQGQAVGGALLLAARPESAEVKQRAKAKANRGSLKF